MPLQDAITALRERYCTRPFEVEPGMAVRCGSRRWSECPSCAALWAGDSARLARSGIYDADAHPVEGYRFFFITLSAPSFGAIHRVPKWERDRGQRCRCRCGKSHQHADTQYRGIPLDLEAYDYVGQVRWHHSLGRLRNATVTAMRRAAPELEFFRVFEAQARLALHAHVIVRIPRGFEIEASTLGTAARNATAYHPVTGDRVAWGQRGVEDREVLPRHRDEPGVLPDASSSIARTLAYTLKTVVSYSLKDIGHGTADEDASPERRRFVHELGQAARATACPRCSDAPALCGSRGHRQHGFSGHVLAMSRPTPERPGWSFSGLTRGRLREERRAWMSAHHATLADRGLDATALVVAAWVQEQQYLRRAERLENVRMARGPNGPS